MQPNLCHMTHDRSISICFVRPDLALHDKILFRMMQNFGSLGTNFVFCVNRTLVSSCQPLSSKRGNFVLTRQACAQEQPRYKLSPTFREGASTLHLHTYL
jgi:hypothetical protein